MEEAESEVVVIEDTTTWEESVKHIRAMLRGAPSQLRLFDLLSDGQWHCRACEGSKIGSGQYAGGGGIQGLKRGARNRPGLEIKTKLDLCSKCSNRKLLDRWTGNTTEALVAANIPPTLARRILRIYNFTDVIENRRREPHKLLIDHRFPMIRWGGTEPTNDPNMTEDEIRRKFQVLKKDADGNHNQLKSRACEICLKKGRRGTPFDIEFWYEGDSRWPLKVQKGPEAEAGCVGCGWYNFEQWRAALNERMRESNSIEASSGS